MNLTYENTINYKDYNRLRDEVKWGALSDEQAQIGLKNSAYIISCKDGDKVIVESLYTKCVKENKKLIKQDKNKDSEIFENKSFYKTIMENMAKEAYKDLKR